MDAKWACRVALAKRYGNNPIGSGPVLCYLTPGNAANFVPTALVLPLMPPTLPVVHAVWPTRWRVLAALALYATYLPLSGYTSDQFRFDAAEYWELSLKFTQHGPFSLLAFDEPLRGYLGPLLILPARVLCHVTGWSMLTGARALGAGWAALLFGVAIPRLWAQATARALTGGRWLLLLGLAFIFWRDYFNFTLSDVPALTLLIISLIALNKPGGAWAIAAGLLLAGAINIRPIYMASLPGCLWLLVGAPLLAGQRGRHAAGLAAGAALLLLPQWLINQQHFGRNTPFVLAERPGSRPLYLKQLAWGTGFQRYESSLIPESPRFLLYADPAGQRALATEPGSRFASYAHYLRFALRQPFATSGRWLRHLFNGLDIRFPTPYPKRLHPPGQAALRLLNYALLGLGTWQAVAAWRRARRRKPTRIFQPVPAAILLALLLPGVLSLPMLMECRFLLPLHLLLLTGVAGNWPSVAGWQVLDRPRQLAFLGVALAWLWGCWQLSEATARQLCPPGVAVQD